MSLFTPVIEGLDKHERCGNYAVLKLFRNRVALCDTNYGSRTLKLYVYIHLSKLSITDIFIVLGSSKTSCYLKYYTLWVLKVFFMDLDLIKFCSIKINLWKNQK